MGVLLWMQRWRLERRFAESVVGEWDSAYFTVSPMDELLKIGADGTGSVSGMCSDVQFRWEPAGPGKMRITWMRYPDEEGDPTESTEPFDCTWRFSVVTLPDGHRRVEMRLSGLGICGYVYGGSCPSALEA